MAVNSILRNKSNTFLRAFASSAKLIRKTQPGHREVLSTAVNRFVPRFHFSSVAVKNNPSSEDDEYLVRVIEEICARDTYHHHRTAKRVPSNFPFKIIDKPGQQTITLERTYEGEEIKVVVGRPGVEHYKETDRQPRASIPISVSVSKKGGPSLEFSCVTYAHEIVIDSLSVKNPDQIPYEGPDFQSLDKNLQKKFKRYLIREIKPSTTFLFLYVYMMKKESREYLVWLNKVKNFIQA